MMPGHNDLSKATAAIPNPFEDRTPRLSEFTAQDIATLQSRLNKQLGPEYISSRPGPGSKRVHYLAAEKAINLANEVFGFNGWSSEIKSTQVDFVDQEQNSGKISLGITVISRVTLKDGTFHEDIGYGHIEGCRGKAAAFEKAKKEAATDAMKRALRNFGNILGNCLYDHDYLQRVTKVKAEPSRWDADNLHRHPDFAPTTKMSAPTPLQRVENHGNQTPRTSSTKSDTDGTGEYDEFGGDVFDEADMNHPDEVMLDSFMNDSSETPQQRANLQVNAAGPGAQARQQIPRTHSMPTLRPQGNLPPHATNTPQTQGPTAIKQEGGRTQAHPNQTNTHPQSRPSPMGPPPMPQYPEPRPLKRPNPSVPDDGSTSAQITSKADQHRTGSNPLPQHRAGQQLGLGQQDPPVGFITSRAAEFLTKTDTPPPKVNAVPAFNPHAESPSIRRTSGVNHAKSEPINRNLITAPKGQLSGPNPAVVSNSVLTEGTSTGAASKPLGQAGLAPANFVNPQSDPGRRIGMPGGGAASPMANRSAYKPPAMKRPAAISDAPRTGSALGRPPLADLSNVTFDIHAPSGESEGKKAGPEVASALGNGEGVEAKRAKVGNG